MDMMMFAGMLCCAAAGLLAATLLYLEKHPLQNVKRTPKEQK